MGFAVTARGLMTPKLYRLERHVETVLLISGGAIVGANLRYFLAVAITRIAPGLFPLSTLVINASASLILGWFLALTAQHTMSDARWRLLVAVGFCGGYSTYSTYAFESFALLESGHWGAFALDVFGMNVVCLLAVAAGVALARLF